MVGMCPGQGSLKSACVLRPLPKDRQDLTVTIDTFYLQIFQFDFHNSKAFFVIHKSPQFRSVFDL
jgi:hypothetical protein